MVPRILGWMRCKTGKILSDNAWDSPCCPSKEVYIEAMKVLDRLIANDPVRLRNGRPSEYEQSWAYSDASESGWGVVFLDKGIRVWSGRFPAGISGAHISIKELWAARMALVAMKNVSSFTLFSDNTNTVSWLTKWNAKSPTAMSLLAGIHRDYGHLNFRVQWIPTSVNPADYPSRNKALPFSDTHVSALSRELVSQGMGNAKQ